VRRKVLELEKERVIKKTGKKIFVDRSAFYAAQAKNTLSELSTLLHEFNKLLKSNKYASEIFEVSEITKSIKENFSFCWYQFYKFLFIYTKSLPAISAQIDEKIINKVIQKKFALLSSYYYYFIS
jgi:hypothetical protein